MTDDDVKQQKDIQFYGVAVNAWINTALEFDRSLLVLSGGAIGLLVTLLATKVGTASVVLLILYIAAMVAFLGCIVSVLVGLHKSKQLMERVVTGRGERDAALDKVDVASRWLFAIGASVLTIIGIWTAALLNAEKGTQVSNERITREGTTELGKSLSGIGNLRPGTGGSAPAQAPAQGSTPAQGTTPAPVPAQQPSSSSK